MPRQPKPWYREDRDAWFVTIAGARHNLGPDKKQAMKRFYALMNAPKTVKVVSESVAAVADAFLEWVSCNRSPDTYEWYRYRIERFCQRYPDLVTNELRPYHVQQWVDSYKELAQNTRRNYVRTVKRCMRWAKQQGHISDDPIASRKSPPQKQYTFLPTCTLNDLAVVSIHSLHADCRPLTDKGRGVVLHGPRCLPNLYSTVAPPIKFSVSILQSRFSCVCLLVQFSQRFASY